MHNKRPLPVSVKEAMYKKQARAKAVHKGEMPNDVGLMYEYERIRKDFYSDLLSLEKKFNCEISVRNMEDDS